MSKQEEQATSTKTNDNIVAQILDGFGDRLAEVMAEQGMSGYQVAKDLGHKRADTVYNIVNKRQYANLKLVVELLQLFPEVDANWLVLGQGTKYRADQESLAKERSFVSSLRTLLDQYEQE